MTYNLYARVQRNKIFPTEWDQRINFFFEEISIVIVYLSPFTASGTPSSLGKINDDVPVQFVDLRRNIQILYRPATYK